MQQQQQQLNQRPTAQQQQQQQQQTNQQMRKTATAMMQPSITRPQDFHFETGSFATSTAATPIQPSVGDPELSDLVNSVIDWLPEVQGNILTSMIPETSSSIQPSEQPQNQKEMAIDAITKSLMQIESSGAFNSSPPAYSMHNVNTSSQVSAETFLFLVLHTLAVHRDAIQHVLFVRLVKGFPPPPVYTQRRNAVGNTATANNNTNNTNNNSNNSNTNNTNATNSPQASPAMRLQFQQQMERERLLQQQQKERLLQQQQKQSLVVPVNATANAEQICTFCFAFFLPRSQRLLNTTYAF